MVHTDFPTIQSRNGLIGGIAGVSSQLAGVCSITKS